MQERRRSAAAPTHLLECYQCQLKASAITSWIASDCTASRACMLCFATDSGVNELTLKSSLRVKTLQLLCPPSPLGTCSAATLCVVPDVALHEQTQGISINAALQASADKLGSAAAKRVSGHPPCWC